MTVAATMFRIVQVAVVCGSAHPGKVMGAMWGWMGWPSSLFAVCFQDGINPWPTADPGGHRGKLLVAAGFVAGQAHVRKSRRGGVVSFDRTSARRCWFDPKPCAPVFFSVRASSSPQCLSARPPITILVVA
jgi:hypothetical protein